VTALLVALGAAVGAPLRYLTDHVLRSWFQAAFPWGTFVVNAVGSLLLGLLVGGGASGALLAVAGAGFCGALTTYSTFSYETLRLVETGAVRTALLNVVGSLTTGVLAAATGWALGAALR
jgi:CrcB protein